MLYESDARAGRGPAAGDRDRGVRGRGIRRWMSVPLAIASTIAVTLGIAQPAEAAPQPVKRQPKAKATNARPATTAAVASTTAPVEYVVGDGDTVSSIAERFGLATAEVLAQNGLSWSSLIFPGQRLALAGSGAHQEAAAVSVTDIAHHIVVDGDTMSGIASAYGLDLDQLISANGLSHQSLIFPGQALVLPPANGGGAPVETAAPDPQPAPPVTDAPDTHVVVDGDTLWDIAARNGVSVEALVEANALDASGVIVVGQAVLIPRPVVVATVASVSVALTDEMRQNAKLIVDVGRALDVPDQGIVIALAAAAQESGLKNVPYGDRDSLGIFQQRPSQGWGSDEEVLDPVHAATAFYGGATNPNAGRTLGLLDITGWEAMTVTQAAQAVQQSAHPDHYAKWEASARAWLSELG
jgi:N-acetylmuramoyl-L-alanine amidase